MMNPAMMMKLGGMLRTFFGNHPKLVAFFQQEMQGGIPEGTVVEITITKPGEAPVSANIKVQESDAELFRTLGQK